MNPIDDCFLSRAEVMRRWRISIATIKRREQQGILRPIRMSTHVIRYRLSDVVRAEDEAAAGREWEETGNDQKEQDDAREAA
jgi:predicted site-specific integrase-resolvase